MLHSRQRPLSSQSHLPNRIMLSAIPAESATASASLLQFRQKRQLPLDTISMSRQPAFRQIRQLETRCAAESATGIPRLLQLVGASDGRPPILASQSLSAAKTATA